MKNLEKIEKYVNGELEESDLWEFKKALETDVLLKNELRQYQEVMELAQNKEKQNLMALLNEIHQENEVSTKKLFLNRHKVSLIAASILLLFAVGGSLFLMLNRNSQEELFASYYSAESASFNVRSASAGMDQPVMQGMQFYELQDYNTALDMFSKVPDNIMGRLYSGLSHIELGEFDKAINDFKFVIKHNDNLFIDQAEWYLALCYLKTNQTKEATKYFEKIAGDRG
ncbi:MAG: tetratricopeptide repeat protein, partial [Bacteroidales bacterium]|nr:tetratricopeptide repeat protein [Bacteroidales bacterium]